MRHLAGWFGKHPRLTLALATIACLAPFLNKAYNIDDPLFLWAAARIQSSPLDFYGFIVNWYGVPQPMSAITQNPPLTCYYLAVAAWLVGWREPALHAAMMPVAIAAIVGAYELARRCCPRPMLAAMLTLASPVFLISATGLMCDVMMLALWTWAVVLWMDGLESGQKSRLASASALMALAVLTKYYAVALVPLLGVYSIVVKRRPTVAMVFLVVPLAALGLYQLVTMKLYGRAMFGEAMKYANDYRKVTETSGLLRVAVPVAFAGGCVLFPVLVLPWLWRWRWSAAALGAGVVGTVAAWPVFAQLESPWPTISAVHMICFGAAGVVLLAVVGEDLWRRRDATAWLLALWVLGAMVFVGRINWSINGRSVLPLVPAAAILIVRRLRTDSRWVYGALALCLVAGILATGADAGRANAERAAARRLMRELQPKAQVVWFQGHWGFQWYMQRLGALPVNLNQRQIIPADVMVLPHENSNVDYPSPDRYEYQMRFEQPVFPVGATLRQVCGAGFYTHQWGLLPYVFGPAPPLIFDVVRRRAVPLEGGKP